MTTNPAAAQYHEYAEGLVLHYTLHEPRPNPSAR